MAQNWFRHFKEGETSLEHQPNSRKLVVKENDALLKMVEQQPSTSTWSLLAELSPSQSTINQDLYKLGLVNRCWNTWNGKYKIA